MRKPMLKKILSIKWTKKHILAVFLFVPMLFVLYILYKSGGLSVYKMQSFLEQSGKWSYGLFFLLCSVRSFLLLPCGIFSMMSGLIFGPVVGSGIVLLGFTVNGGIVYKVSRYLGRSQVEKMLKGRGKTAVEFLGGNGFLSIFLMRILPILPFDAVSCIGGVAKVPFSKFLMGTFVGSIPGVIAYTYFGYSVKTMSVEKILFALSFIALLALIPLIYRTVHRKKTKLE